MSQFLPEDAEDAINTLVGAQISGLNVGSIGEKDLNSDGQIVFKTPAARTRYPGTQYTMTETQAQTYNCEHMIEVWCAASNLRSKEAQRNDTKELLGKVLPVLAGARLKLSDGGKSEPVRIVGIEGVEQDIVGMVYILTVAVPGIAQFPGTNG